MQAHDCCSEAVAHAMIASLWTRLAEGGETLTGFSCLKCVIKGCLKATPALLFIADSNNCGLEQKFQRSSKQLCEGVLCACVCVFLLFCYTFIPRAARCNRFKLLLSSTNSFLDFAHFHSELRNENVCRRRQWSLCWEVFPTHALRSAGCQCNAGKKKSI